MIFFKVFLELKKKSLINYLAFDSKSIKLLLDDGDGLSGKNSKCFGSEFPVFYKNSDYRSAIDIALEKN